MFTQFLCLKLADPSLCRTIVDQLKPMDGFWV